MVVCGVKLPPNKDCYTHSLMCECGESDKYSLDIPAPQWAPDDNCLSCGKHTMVIPDEWIVLEDDYTLGDILESMGVYIVNMEVPYIVNGKVP